MDKKIPHLPKDGLSAPDGPSRPWPSATDDDVEGHRRVPVMNQDPQQGVGPEDARLIDETDVEGHGLPLTAPPSFGSRHPGHGGENIPSPVDDEDDVEGHRRY